MTRIILNRATIVLTITLAMSFAGTALADDCRKSGMVSDESVKDIVDTAVAAGSFNTLVTAVQAAGLVDALKSEGPFTVFAPTDEAFARLPEGTLESLLQDKEKLTAVLTYHVVPGKLMSGDVTKIDSAETLQGSSLSLDSSRGIRVDNANVIRADIETSNGVIHVIDSVILP